MKWIQQSKTPLHITQYSWRHSVNRSQTNSKFFGFKTENLTRKSGSRKNGSRKSSLSWNAFRYQPTILTSKMESSSPQSSLWDDIRDHLRLSRASNSSPWLFHTYLYFDGSGSLSYCWNVSSLLEVRMQENSHQSRAGNEEHHRSYGLKWLY